MNDLDVVATALANKNVLIALIDYIEGQDPKVRTVLTRAFEAATAIAQRAGETYEERMLARSVEVALEMVQGKTGRPRLTLVPDIDRDV